MKHASLMIVAIASIAFASAARADVITFDPDGGGSIAGMSVSSFDFLPGNALADFGPNDPIGQADNGQSGNFTVYFQTRLGSLLGPNGEDLPVPGLNQPNGFEITAVAQFDVSYLVDNNQIQFQGPTGRGTNFVRLYYSEPNADDLAGTGFHDGQLILDGPAVAAVGLSQMFEFVMPFDTFGPNNYPAIASLFSIGSVFVQAEDFLTLDPAFFLTAVDSMQVASNLKSPFSEANPSAVFDHPNGPVTPVIGPVNGAAEDVQLQTDATASFLIPEPATAALLGVGLLAVAARRRR